MSNNLQTGMLDDLIESFRVGRRTDRRTAIGTGRNLIIDNLDMTVSVIGLGLFYGFLQVKDALILFVYGTIPLVLDSSVLLELFSIIGRFLPRATILLDLGSMGVTTVVGISLASVITTYAIIGRAKISINHFRNS